MSWRERFNMSGPPLPRGVAGDTFFEGDPNFQRLARVFAWLAAEPGIGVITGEPGVGKTAAMRHLCRSLPQHEHRIVYLSDTTVKPLDIYRMLAAELGLRPGPRAQIVGDIKRALVTLVDEQSAARLPRRASLSPISAWMAEFATTRPLQTLPLWLRCPFSTPSTWVGSRRSRRRLQIGNNAKAHIRDSIDASVV